jgi:hypothetical protein
MCSTPRFYAVSHKMDGEAVMAVWRWDVHANDLSVAPCSLFLFSSAAVN